MLIVAMNYAPEPSGTAPYTSALAAHLAQEHRVTALVGVPHYPQWRIAPGYGCWRSDAEEQGVRVIRLRHHVPSGTKLHQRLLHESTFAARALSQRLADVDAIVAVTPPLLGVTAARALALRYRVRLGVIVQDLYSAGARELRVGGKAGIGATSRFESHALRSASQVSVIHESFRRTLVDDLGVTSSRVDVIPNWTQTPPARADREEVRASWGWTEKVVALHAGNMGSKQGLETLIAAARHIDSAGPAIQFVLMGDGNQRRQLEGLADGVQGITFVDSVPDDEYGDALAAADVLVVNERPGVAGMSVPSKLTSYFAAGRPVVASCDPAGTTAEVIQTSGGGVIVPAGDARGLVEAISRLVDDPAVADGLGAAGARWARDHLAAAPTLARYSEWVEELLARRR